MTPKELIRTMQSLQADELETLRQKNSDYSNSNAEASRNFYAVENMGICSAEKGLMVRLTDKYMRITNLLEKAENFEEPAVKDESLCDAISDARNYLGILRAVIEDKQNKESNKTVSEE